MYFDYKDEQKQSRENVVATLLKQLATHLEVIPSKVEKMYNECVRRGTRPEFSELFEAFITCSKLLDSVLVMFDAFDECNNTQQHDILDFIQGCVKSGVRFCATTRPHIRQGLQDQLQDCVIRPIAAQNADIVRYLTARLAGSQFSKFSKEVRTEIPEAIIKSSKGM